jgi:chromosome segregation protein
VPAGADDRGDVTRDSLVERVDGIAAWINDLDSRLRATELATSDEKTAKELRRAIEALAKHDPKLEKRLIDRVDVLSDRLATLGSTVSTTAAALARKDGEIAALRKSVEDESRRVETLVRELGKGAGAEEVEKLRAAVRAVQAERPARVSDSRIENLGGRIDYLTERIDTLAKTVATTAAGLVGRDGEIATLRQRLDEGSARVEQTAADVRRMQGDGALARRLDTLQDAIDETKASFEGRESDVAGVRARIDEAYSRVGTVVAGIQSSIAALTAQVDELDALPGATERLEARSAELSGRIDEIAGQVVTLAKSLDAATSSLEERRAEVARLDERAGEASTRLDSVVADLRQTLDRLPEPGTIDPEVESRLEALAGSVGEVTEQLVGLAEASSAHAEQAAARAETVEGSLAEIGDRLNALEQERERAVTQLEATGAAWSEERRWVRSKLEALGVAHADVVRTSEGFGPVLDALTARLDALDADRTAATSEIARVSVALDDERARLNAQLEGLASALAEATAPTGRDEASERVLGELGTRLDGLEQDGAAVAAEIGRLAAVFDTERDALRAQLDGLSTAFAEAVATGASDDAEQKLDELAARLERMEQGGLTTSSEITRVAAAFEAEREALRGQLDGLSAALADATAQTDDTAAASTEALLNALSARIATVEAHGAAVASEISRASAAWASERDAIDARLARVTTTSTEAGGAVAAVGERVLAELGERVTAMERDRQAVAAEVARATGAWEEERAALEERLDEVASQLASAEARPPSPGPDASEGEVTQLRVMIEGIRMRLASSEQEVAALVGTRDATTRLDELTRRLESLERAPVVVAGRGDGAALPGDGRFRLELRALELRMEHAEAAARENREAVLVQLERLAARIDWRFKRLEEEYESRQPQAVGGQVVPLRPEV